MGNSHLSMRKIASVSVLQIKCWCNSKSIAEPTFVIFPCFFLKFSGHVHTNPHILKRPKYNFYPDWCGQGLSLFPTGERFQNNVVLVTGFTGFVWTGLRPIRVKMVRAQFKTFPHSCGRSLNQNDSKRLLNALISNLLNWKTTRRFWSCSKPTRITCFITCLKLTSDRAQFVF